MAVNNYMERRGKSYIPLVIFFTLFVIFLYGPMFAIITLSFQGPDGGLTFPCLLYTSPSPRDA